MYVNEAVCGFSTGTLGVCFPTAISDAVVCVSDCTLLAVVAITLAGGCGNLEAREDNC